MTKIPPNRRKGTTRSLRKIADKLDIPFGKGRPVKPATAGPVPPKTTLEDILEEDARAALEDRHD